MGFKQRIVAPVLIVLTLAQYLSAQDRREAYKFAEYDGIGHGCEEYGRLTLFEDEVMTSPKNLRGLIVIYRGEKDERFGNLLGYVLGATGRVRSHNVPAGKIDFVIAEGKSFFSEEFWIIPEGADVPVVREATFDWTSIKTKYHFSTACLKCEPSYPELTTSQPNYEDFAAVLKKNPSLKGVVAVKDYDELREVRSALTKGLKLARNRYLVVVETMTSQYDYGINLYLVPNNNNVRSN